ncbi:energy-coupling factor transporter ATPase [Selenomonas sp.]|uniref:energy-coupling factor transporter ATPase n=1 Tax=Selenomonas sp. TaxID=2053611 RepID=UPI003FA25890
MRCFCALRKGEAVVAEFIRAEHLSHVFHAGEDDAYRALSDVSLSVDEGEFLAVLGTNGSGKSTLARHFNALLLPTEGRCTVAGLDTKETADLWRIRQLVSMVFQNPDNQIIAAVVEDDVAFGPENLGIEPAEIRMRVRDALTAVGMERYRTAAPHLLSGGQKQRVAIAGALAMNTRCLVLDEPTAMLDPIGRQDVLETVRRLHRENGITVVYITHFMEEAAAADRVVVMEEGRIAAEGSPREVFQDVGGMKARGLDVPLAVEVASLLREAGVSLPADLLTDEELVSALCPS